MKNINFGIAKKCVLNTAIENFIENEKINESTTKFFNVVKNSPVLATEFEVYKNLEEMHIDNDSLAGKYIDNNIKLFENFNSVEIQKAHDELKEFITETTEDVKLYNSINILIIENDVNKVHEAYVEVLNHLKSNKPVNKETVTKFKINEKLDIKSVISIAVNKFNEKYSSLNEDERKLIFAIVSNDTKRKEELLESLKKDTIARLNQTKTVGIEDKIHESINKINKMRFDNKSFLKDSIKLNNLKNSLT